MNFLLDTHAFLWMTDETAHLSPKAGEALMDANNTLYLSSISSWEIAQKYRVKKLPLPFSPIRFVMDACAKHDINLLAFETESCKFLEQLPLLHRDPFDRMLICQAIARNLTILTNDRLISQYPVATLW